jgi:hypothetical protein
MLCRLAVDGGGCGCAGQLKSASVMECVQSLCKAMQLLLRMCSVTGMFVAHAAAS